MSHQTHCYYVLVGSWEIAQAYVDRLHHDLCVPILSKDDVPSDGVPAAYLTWISNHDGWLTVVDRMPNLDEIRSGEYTELSTYEDFVTVHSLSLL